MHPFKHFHTITKHRRIVRHYCFKAGLIWQGLTHDLSKYSYTEFRVGAKYYTGMKSPNAGERIDTGISTAWIHHKGRNKHHYEYWTDYCIATGDILTPVKMPTKYLVESVCDRIAACKVYKAKEYYDGAPLDYYTRREETKYMHPDTYKAMGEILTMLRDKGEEETFKYLRKLLKDDKKNRSPKSKTDSV